MSRDRKDKYQDLLALLEKEGRYGVLKWVREEADLQDRRAVAKEFFGEMVRCGDDKGAAAAVNWIMQATEDIHLVPLLGDDMTGPYVKNVDAVEHGVDRDRAGEAMGLWDFLPDSRDEKVRVPINGDRDTELRSVDAPAFPVTKRTLLMEIVRRWRKTDDEEEADRLFDFLCGLKLKHAEDRELLEKTVREEGTIGYLDDNGRITMPFPPQRAARHFLELMRRKLEKGSRYRCEFTGLARLLSIAWIRNGKEDQRMNWMRAVLPMFASSDAAFDALQGCASELAALDAKVEVLLKELKGNSPFNSCRIRVRYGRGREVTVSIEFPSATFNGFFATSNTGQFDANRAHDRFEALVGRTRQWREETGERIRVILEMTVPNEHKPDELKFSRSRVIE